MGLSTSALKAHVRGPLAAAMRHYDPRDVILGLLDRAPPREVGLINTLRYIDFKHTLAGGVLVKVDRACMAVALEVRRSSSIATCCSWPAPFPVRNWPDRVRPREALKVAVESWPRPATFAGESRDFRAREPLPHESNGAEWARCAGSVLLELIDASLLKQWALAGSTGKCRAFQPCC